ncbi:MAG: (2Fe-2S)-binding protein [Leptospiraceae bacterium]|nr:(2Fe-2S)-binding protein [Leptospiraceae bacterium]
MAVSHFRPVCNCCRVSARDIGEAVSRSTRMPSFETILATTGAGSQCGACLGDVYSIYLSRRHLRKIQQEDQMPLPFLVREDQAL